MGQALIPVLQSKGVGHIKILGRDEGKLLETQRRYGVEICLGDVTDYYAVERAMHGVNQVYHLAGFKHLPLGEDKSQECIKTNVMGSINVLEAATTEDVELVLGVSTDKAYHPMNCYGMTKRLMEYLFDQYHREWGWSDRVYRIVRYGNVLGSTGSVLQVWREAAEKNQPLKITDPDMTRFFFRVEDAVSTIIECLEKATDATPFIPNMKAVRMGELADVCKTILENRLSKPVTIEVVGLRPGEKLHEGMADDAQSDAAEKYTKEELFELVRGIL